MNNTIVLYLENNTWLADHIGEHAAAIEDIFGTSIIPTAYTAGMKSAEVKARISKLNPNVNIVIE